MSSNGVIRLARPCRSVICPRGAHTSCDDRLVSRHGTLQTVGPDISTERNFDLVLRGYHRREVDRYVGLLEQQVTALTNERQEYDTQVRNLTAQLHRVQMELLELRRQPTGIDKISFRHLGPRAEQILALAEEQAEAIREQARADVESDQKEIKRLLGETHRRHDRVLEDGLAELETRRDEQNRELARLKQAALAEAGRVNSAAEQYLADAERTLENTRQEADRMRAEAVSQAQAIRAKAEDEAGTLGAGAELYAQQVRTAAEQHAQQTRASAEQHAQQTRSSAEQAANEIRVQAERHASQIRSGAEQHGARLHASAQQAAEQIQQKAEREAAELVAQARYQAERIEDEAQARPTQPGDGRPGAAANRHAHRHPPTVSSPKQQAPEPTIADETPA